MAEKEIVKAINELKDIVFENRRQSDLRFDHLENLASHTNARLADVGDRIKAQGLKIDRIMAGVIQLTEHQIDAHEELASEVEGFKAKERAKLKRNKVAK